MATQEADESRDGAAPAESRPQSTGIPPGTAPTSPAPEVDVEAVDRVLDEVERALTRLDEGTYGQCAACGAPIADHVLSDDPTTRACSECRPTDD